MKRTSAADTSFPASRTQAEIEVPIPGHGKPACFNRLQAKMLDFLAAQQDIDGDFNVMLPLIMDNSVRQEL